MQYASNICSSLQLFARKKYLLNEKLSFDGHFFSKTLTEAFTVSFKASPAEIGRKNIMGVSIEFFACMDKFLFVPLTQGEI